MRLIARFSDSVFATGAILFVLGAVGGRGHCLAFLEDLPDYTQLQNYEPPVMTRVHAADGSLLAEYARERRLYLPIRRCPWSSTPSSRPRTRTSTRTAASIPKASRAPSSPSCRARKRAQGASTITQQVAKNFLLTASDFDRKISEAMLAFRIEAAYSKDKILELYLNEIYLGLGNYGVAAAALNYFGKSVHELTIAEAAYLAALPKGAEQLPSVPQAASAAIDRRNWVIDRMVGGRLHHQARRREGQGRAARRQPARASPNTFAAGYFAEEVRREICRALRREEALRGRPVGAHHARSRRCRRWPARRWSTASCATTRRTACAAPCAKST